MTPTEHNQSSPIAAKALPELGQGAAKNLAAVTEGALASVGSKEDSRNCGRTNTNASDLSRSPNLSARETGTVVPANRPKISGADLFLPREEASEVRARRPLTGERVSLNEAALNPLPDPDYLSTLSPSEAELERELIKADEWWDTRADRSPFI